MEELEGRLEELGELAAHGKKYDVGQSVTPGLPGTKPSTKGYTWFQPKVTKEGLVGHQWEERSLVI